jgi:type I restriction enzyme, S subunit
MGKKKTSPVFTNNGDPFFESLPQDWQVCPLGDFVDADKSTINPQDYPNESFDYYSIPAYQISIHPDIEQGHKILSQKLLVETGTVLFGKLNPRVPKVWQICLESGHRKIASTEFIPLSPIPHKADSDFLYFLCWSDRVMKSAQELVSGSTPSRQRTDVRAFLQLPLPLPPLPEQRAIAQVLQTVQRAKEATEKVIAACRQLKKSLMRHLFTYGPVPFDQADKVELKETEIGPMPEHWDVVPLNSIATLASGGTPSKQRPEFWIGTIPWVSPKDMKAPRLIGAEDHISEDGLKDGSRLVQPGSLFIVVRGMILAKDLPIALAMVPMAFNQDMKAILPNKETVLSEYLLYAMIHHKPVLLPEIGTSAHGTRRIGTSAIERFPIPIPSKQEQEVIVGILATVDQMLDKEKARHNALSTLFNTLLHHLMTGKVRISEIDFPANAEGLS